jgi:basic membrane protein A and related proteins
MNRMPEFCAGRRRRIRWGPRVARSDASRLVPIIAALVLTTACNKKAPDSIAYARRVGLVIDVAGRGDQSFNDSALRGLELWAAGKKYTNQSYRDLSGDELQRSIPAELASLRPPIHKLPVTALVLHAKGQEDYEPSLQLLVEQGSGLTIATGSLLQNALGSVARKNPKVQFLLIDGRLIDSEGKAYSLPNVRTIVFRDHEGSFLVGALAGGVTTGGRIGFVGGMDIPLIKKFEAGFRAGVMVTNPKAARELMVAYTGSFDNVAAGKRVAHELLSKGADVIFQAAGSAGLGVVMAVKEDSDSGRRLYAIGVDSDQWNLAPNAVLTSMIKRVDLVVYQTVRDWVEGKFSGGDLELGVKEDAVGYAPIRLELSGRQQLLDRVEALRRRVASGEIRVPSTIAELNGFRPNP